MREHFVNEKPKKKKTINQQKVPEGDWYCNRCKPNQQPQPQRKKRQAFVYSEEDEEEDNAEDEVEDEDDSDESDSSGLGGLFDDST